MVERDLPKVDVEGSIPFTRSSKARKTNVLCSPFDDTIHEARSLISLDKTPKKRLPQRRQWPAFPS